MFHSHTRLSPKQTLFPMLYLLLNRDLQKISLARKYVLSKYELSDALNTITWITHTVRRRTNDLEGGKVVLLPVILVYLASAAAFEQRGLPSEELIPFYAGGLVGVTSSRISVSQSDRRDTVLHAQQGQPLLQRQASDVTRSSLGSYGGSYTGSFLSN